MARRRWLVILLILFAGSTGYNWVRLQPATYSAQARLFLATDGPFDPFNTQGSGDPARYVLAQSRFATSSAVLDEAQKQLPGLTDAELQSHVQVDAASDTNILTIHASASSPAIAVRISTAIANAYETVVQTQVRDQVTEIAKRSDVATASQARVKADAFGSGVSYTDLPTNAGRSGLSSTMGALVGVVVGLLLGGALAFTLEERAARRRRALGWTTFGAPTLGAVPAATDLPSASDPRTPVARQAAAAVVALDLQLRRSPGSVVLVTSLTPHQAGSAVTAHLAAAATRRGGQVLLVDANPSASSLTRGLGLAPGPGLLALGDESAHALQLVTPWELDGQLSVHVLPAGSSAGRSEGLGGSRLQAALRNLHGLVDLVLIDSPPLLTDSSSLALAADVDGIVLLIDEGCTPEQIEDAQRLLSLTDTPILGVVALHRESWWSRKAARSGGGAAPASAVRPAPARDQGLVQVTKP